MALTKIITDTIDLSSDTTGLKMPKGTTSGTLSVQYLVVAGGGGGGGNSNAGGGGAGGYLTGTTSVNDNTALTIDIGAGGTGVNAATTPASNGGNSIFASIIATGGGGGGAYDSDGSDGGSGGGGGYNNRSGGSGSQGNNGGDGKIYGCYPGAGGGGAGSAGTTPPNNTSTGPGGDGLQNTITGILPTPYYAGGGGGGISQSCTTAATGGQGGGGDGGVGNTIAPQDGTANTGGGGGGGTGTYNTGSTGGTGIIILRVASTVTATFANATTALTQVGGGAWSSGDKVYTITANTSSATVIFTQTETTGRPSNPTVGTLRENTTTGKMEIYTGVKGWRALQQTDQVAAGVVPSNNFNAVLYTGNDSTNPVSVGFAPDFSWIKCRTDNRSNTLIDTVRGATNVIQSESTNIEWDGSSYVQSFDANGFTVKSNAAFINSSSQDYVSWNWKAGGNSNTFNVDGVGYATAAAAGMNTGTNPPSACSVNTETGFSIVKFIGDGVAGATIDHGLSSSPQLILVKNLDVADNWAVYNSTSGATKYMNLNATYSVGTATSIWNDTEPTSTVFSVGTSTDVNGSGNDLIAYSFHSVPNYSLIGSYEGTGDATNTPIIYTGFEPAWIMVKSSTSSRAWNITDNKRNTTNPRNSILQAQSTDKEYTDVAYNINFYNDGFQIVNANTGWNILKETYIFMCFAA